MSKDFRNEFIQSVELSILFLIPDKYLSEKVTTSIIKILNDYELSERNTELIVTDSLNERILKRYIACLRIDGKSETTIRQYYRTVIKLEDLLHKDYPEMGVYDIRYFLACEKDRGVSNRTLENIRANLSAFFQWLTLEEYIPKNPCANIKPIKYTDKIRLPFSPVEIDKMRSSCKTYKERALIEVLLASGIRVSELTSLKVSDIDFSALTLCVKHGKGNKQRMVYITEVVRLHLKKYLLSRSEDGDYLFYNNKHAPLRNNGVRDILNRLGSRCGIENVYPHRFRRTFASGLALRGMKVQDIMELLGHSNLDTTMEYVYTDTEKVGRSYRQYIA